MTIDLQKSRREGMRWYLLVAMHRGEPLGCSDHILKTIMDDIYGKVTPSELHQQLSYLEKKQTVTVTKSPDGHWHGRLTAVGIDIVDYTVDCPAGIARPAKYWE
ncbi:hypothetical protein [Psychrobacter lutiphocae]|uniref:hypothetical protein n=1 Tax=Psychrobacter lutiphocae TaxID=540500 RepID=UPI00035E9CFC|nr:hypothetical protein [Psychrobacter lutiphocae]